MTASPERVSPDEEARLAFTVPNEGTTPLLDVRVALRGLAVEAVEAKAGWRTARAGATVVWRGGEIRAGEFDTFSVTGTPTGAGRIEWRVTSGGETSSGAIDVAPPARGTSSSTAKIALGVGIAAAVVAVGTFFVALAIWLRGPRDELQES